jgi:hypothetical protein
MKPLPIVAFVALLSAVGAQANDITAEEMFEKHVSQNDDVGVANTFMRCSGLLALMAKETENLSQQVFQESLLGAGAMQGAAKMIYSSEGRNYEQETITGWTVDWANHYQGRFETNLVTTGEKFGSDEQIKSDLRFCNGMAQVVQGA